jgi:hypothetical protein
VFSEAFASTVSWLRAMNRTVHVWEPVPGAHQSVPLALARGGSIARIEVNLEEYRATFRYFFDVLEKSCKAIEGSYSPASLLCASGACAVTNAGTPLYFDNGHMTRSSAYFWIGVLLNETLNSRSSCPGLDEHRIRAEGVLPSAVRATRD